MKSRNLISCILLLGILIGATAIPAFGAGDDKLTAPGYIVDFSEKLNVTNCYDIFHMSTELADGALHAVFEDNQNGSCFDPYFSFCLDTGVYEAQDYPYLAMLIKTDKYDKFGEIRLRTTSTGGDFPCYRFTYEQTDDYQLIVMDLTDVKTVLYYTSKEIKGKYTCLRLDPFENDCAPDTEYYVRGYALYDSLKAAKTFDQYIEQYEKEKEEENKVDNSKYWRGKEFDTPSLSSRMRWVSYGFKDATYKSDIERFLSQGYGGIVSNVNFNKDYLKDENEFRILSDVYKKAAESGMKTWIYDEYQWPSGKAFGLVLEGHDEYQSTGIEMLTVTGNGGVSYALPENYIKIMAAELTDADGARDIDFADKNINAKASGDWTLKVFALRLTYRGVEDRNKFETLRDVDLLNPDAVARFIELTYQKYKDEMGDAFQLVEAFFTDEPQLGNRGQEDFAVWTEKLPEKFKAKYGYDLDIKNIFYGDSAEARVQRQNYYQLVSELFAESYTGQIAKWCEQNGTAASGHLLFEENMNDHVETYGGGFLNAVGNMTYPGVDTLWVVPDDLLNPSAYIGNYLGIKYVSSAAKNRSKDQVMIEFNPACSDKETLDKNPLYYSLGGASFTRLLGATTYNVINPQNTYTLENINALNTYIGRLNTLLDGAVQSSDLALYYPIETIQAYHDAETVHSGEAGKGTSTSEKLNLKYENFALALLQAKADFTVIDEQAILDSIITSDGYMLIGDGAYKVITLAFAEYINPAVLEKLVIFEKAGGKIFFVGNKPEHSTVMGKDDSVVQLMNSLEGKYTEFSNGNALAAEAVSEASSHKLNVSGLSEKGTKSIMISDFELEDKDITFIVNLEKDKKNFNVQFTDGFVGQYLVYVPAEDKVIECTGASSVEIASYTGILVVRDADNTHSYTPFTEETTAEETTGEEIVTTDETTVGDNETSGADETTAGNKDESGCGSIVGLGALAVMAVGALAFRKKED